MSNDSDLGDFSEQEPETETDAEIGGGTTQIERTDVGVSITTELKRGSGTRDQDKHTLKAKGETLRDAVEKHQKGMDYLESDVMDRSRKMQPGQGSEE